MAIGAVVAIVATVVAVIGGDDDDPTAGSGETSGASADGTYPMSFSRAQDEGRELDFGARCDPATGRLRTPDDPDECYLPFEGDNGGATAPGVTGETIRIVYYLPLEEGTSAATEEASGLSVTNAQRERTIQGVLEYFETYYETYGRDVELEVYQGSAIASDATAARADAVRIAEELKPFQVWGSPEGPAFGEELVARGIQCINCAAGDQEFYEESDPYVFISEMTGEQTLDQSTAFLTSQLVGKNAEFAGEALRDQERVFGLLYIEGANDESTVRQEYADRGVELAEAVPYTLDFATLQETASGAIARLKQAGVTTVILDADPLAPAEFTKEATAQDWFPEWYASPAFSSLSVNYFARTFDQRQWAHAFGLTTFPARVGPDVDITGSISAIYKWFHGEEPPQQFPDATTPMLIFFRALQAVGPNLTPETFRDALFRVEPTPTGVFNRSMSFGDHGRWPDVETDYTGADDVTVIWYDAEATGIDELGAEGQGLWQFVDGGSRYLLEDWDEAGDIALFDPDAAIGLYTEADLPTEEALLDYEPLPAGQ